MYQCIGIKISIISLTARRFSGKRKVIFFPAWWGNKVGGRIKDLNVIEKFKITARDKHKQTWEKHMSGKKPEYRIYTTVTTGEQDNDPIKVGQTY